MSDKPDIKELAVATWRLEKWLDNLVADRKMAAKSALRGIKKYISAYGIEIKDPIGAKFDPGLAVEVVNNENEDAEDSDLIIIETLSPYLYQNGELIQHAKVIIGTAIKEAKANIALENRLSESIPTDSDKPTYESDTVITNANQNSVRHDEEIKISSNDIERMMEYAKIL